METSAAIAATSSPQATTRRFQDMGSEEYFSLLIAELQSQDPMNPTDNQQLLNQMSSIQQMELSTTLNETLMSLAVEQRFGATSSLIGHYISGTVTNKAGDSFEIQGVVIGVRFEPDGEAILELHNGESLPAAKVDQVTLVENLPPEILEQLQAEMGIDPTEEESSEKSKNADASAARLAVADPANPNPFRGIGSHVDGITSLINSMVSPGVSIGI